MSVSDRFIDLAVTAVRKTIRDAVEVTLEPALDFIPGQYLTFRRDFDGVELRRSYSICAGLDDGLLQVGIKRVPGGAFSTWANEALRPGDVVQVMPPMGAFCVALQPGAARNYLMFAGGSGITPLLSILKTVLAREPLATVTLVYANRAMRTIMFREELEDLKNLYMGRLVLIHVLEEDAQDVGLLSGRVDGAKCAALFGTLVDIAAMDMALICGPAPMREGIVDALVAAGMAPEQIKYEQFLSAQPGRLARPVSAGEAQSEAVDAQITLDGTTRRVPVAADQTVLDAALAANLDAPFACKAGVCSSCRCRVVEGSVEMAANHALEDDEVARGYVLSCQAFVVSAHLVVDYDA